MRNPLRALRRKSFATTVALAVCSFGGQALAASTCNDIAASRNPAENYANIYACLAAPAGVAQLDAGIFPLSRKITMPNGSKLVGIGADHKGATLSASPDSNQPWGDALAQRYPDNTVLEVSDDNVVEALRVTGNGQLHIDCCTSVVVICGSQSRLHDVEIVDLDPANGQLPQESIGGRPVGLHFMGSSASSGNVADKVAIHDVYIGVVFRSGLPALHANTVADSEIFNTFCDGISLSGYGILRNNVIHGSGVNCGQKPTPVPGAGLYATNNQSGAELVGNKIMDVCGNGMDIVNSKRFLIKGNSVRFTGSPLMTKYPYCVGGTPGNFVDINDFTIAENSFEAVNTAPLGKLLSLFPSYAADFRRAYAPLPNRNKQIVAVRLLKWKGTVTNNKFDDNAMVARCDAQDTCVGIGLYVGPGTGVGGDGKWAASTSDYFTRNSVAGSNIGSLRCGFDWYAGNSVCTANRKDKSCNDDDFKHTSDVKANWSRNNSCATP